MLNAATTFKGENARGDKLLLNKNYFHGRPRPPL